MFVCMLKLPICPCTTPNGGWGGGSISSRYGGYTTPNKNDFPLLGSRSKSGKSLQHFTLGPYPYHKMHALFALSTAQE